MLLSDLNFGDGGLLSVGIHQIYPHKPPLSGLTFHSNRFVLFICQLGPIGFIYLKCEELG
jgi:hypothetical protein